MYEHKDCSAQKTYQLKEWGSKRPIRKRNVILNKKYKVC